MEKIIAIYCTCETQFKSKYPDYKSPVYEKCGFVKLSVYDGKSIRVFKENELCNIGFLFQKNVTLIAFNAFFHFSLLFHHLHKQGLTFDPENCGNTCCVLDLCRQVKHKVPKYSLEGAVDTFKYLRPIVASNIVLREMSKFWITDGDEKPEQGGKWLIFAYKAYLQSIWEKVVASRSEIGYDLARVSTMAVDIWGGTHTFGVIQVFIRTEDLEEVHCIGETIKRCCMDEFVRHKVRDIRYKTNKQTKIGTTLTGVRKNTSMRITCFEQ